MFAVVKMFGGVPVLGRVAAADMAAFHAQAQVNPGIARFNAIFADVRLRARNSGMEKMSAAVRHWNNLPHYAAPAAGCTGRSSSARSHLPVSAPAS